MLLSNSHIIIQTANELTRFTLRQVLYFSADGNYTNLHLAGGETRMLSMQLGVLIEEMQRQIDAIQRQFPGEESPIVRIGKSLVVNIQYVFYINIAHQQLVLCDNNQTMTTLSPSKEALKALREYLLKQQ